MLRFFEYEGVVRPYGQQRASGRTTLPPAAEDAAPEGENNKNEPEKSTQASTECPTQQPYVATQLSNTHNGTSLRNHSAISSSPGIDSSNKAPDDAVLWPYTQMLVVVAATGVGLLFLNAIVVVCFFAVRRRGARDGAPPAGGASHRQQNHREEALKRFVLHERELHEPNCERVRCCAGKIAGANRVESVSSIIDLTCPRVTSSTAASSGGQVEHFTGDSFPFNDQSHSSPSMCNKVDSAAIELFDCYAYDDRFLPPAAADNEITV